MAYSDFTLPDIERKLGLTIAEHANLFADTPEAEVGARLGGWLAEYAPLALAINTEKARSEFLIAPILGEVRSRLRGAVSLFSGVDFTVDAARGLNGTCDFLLTRSAQQQYVRSPVMTIIEAKNDNPKSGLGQCIATALGARIFNERNGEDIGEVFGAVTTGTLWRFLRLEGDVVTLDQHEYHIERAPKILGILLETAGGAQLAPV